MSYVFFVQRALCVLRNFYFYFSKTIVTKKIFDANCERRHRNKQSRNHDVLSRKQFLFFEFIQRV